MAAHPDWKVIEDHHLEREWDFADFASALEFVNKVGTICEDQNHHAEFELGWGRVLVRTWSHDIEGLSKRDWDLIKEIDRMV
ncbi:MAG: 4a-hydroxytetrahydrobiopterin dehydratase [Candidatus Thalassarchaeaceae archaeon]|nr:4a-hydroxytetrahydrobiopterin dehydratase [Candidatus Thalassarchaeaceae archaeon]